MEAIVIMIKLTQEMGHVESQTIACVNNFMINDRLIVCEDICQSNCNVCSTLIY